MTAAIRIDGEPAGAGTWAVPSKTFPGETWTVTWVSEGAAWCPCPAHHRRNCCRHVQAVALAIETEAREMVATTPEQRAEAAARLREIEEEFAR